MSIITDYIRSDLDLREVALWTLQKILRRVQHADALRSEVITCGIVSALLRAGSAALKATKNLSLAPAVIGVIMYICDGAGATFRRDLSPLLPLLFKFTKVFLNNANIHSCISITLASFYTRHDSAVLNFTVIPYIVERLRCDKAYDCIWSLNEISGSNYAGANQMLIEAGCISAISDLMSEFIDDGYDTIELVSSLIKNIVQSDAETAKLIIERNIVQQLMQSYNFDFTMGLMQLTSILTVLDCLASCATFPQAQRLKRLGSITFLNRAKDYLSLCHRYQSDEQCAARSALILTCMKIKLKLETIMQPSSDETAGGKEGLYCTICLDTHLQQECVVTSCGHNFGLVCYESFVESSDGSRRVISCPCCRASNPSVLSIC
jgi:hypothetical protein